MPTSEWSDGLRLRAENVRVEHGATVAISGATLELASGEMLSVLGPNGAGKSSLVGAIAGLYPAAGGSVSIGEANVTELPAYQRARLGLGVVPETSILFPYLTVLEVLQVTSKHRRGDRWPMEAIFDLFPSLERRSELRVGNLSGGERQMLAIARALVADPAILILDEPSAGLAPIIVGQLANVVEELSAAGIGIVIFEQSVLLAERLGCDAISINQGVLGGPVNITSDLESLKNRYFGTSNRAGSPSI